MYHQFGNSARLGVAWREIGGRSAALLVLFLVLVVMNVPAAQARKGTRIGVGIGAGIIGAIILNELAREDEVTKSRASSGKNPASKGQQRQPAGTQKQAKRAATAAATKATETPAVVSNPRSQGADSPISTTAEITAAQQHLKYMDYDVPHATGDLDPKTKAAIATFQKTIGASPTGILTAKQLQALFVKAAERQAQSK